MNILTLNCRRLNIWLKRNSIKNDIIIMSGRKIYNGEQSRRMEERMEAIFYYHPFSNKSKGQSVIININFPRKDLDVEIFSDRCVGLIIALKTNCTLY